MVFDWLLLFHELENYLSLLIRKGIIQKAFTDYTVHVEDDKIVHLYELNVQYPKDDKWIKIAESDNMMIFYDTVKKWLEKYIKIS